MFVYKLCPALRVCKESVYRAAIHNDTHDRQTTMTDATVYQ